ncbi:MAG: RnfABCDGE type electron transport complex subunit D [Sphaerochaetaceae bacterium]|nr:RnfABCDGE type electron transport complex subunit D [Sphaerochaetaceae bacterium]
MKKVSSSPHIHSGASTQNIMFSVALALTPACLWGVYAFGLRALVVLLVSIGTSLLVEYLLGKVSKEYTLWDGSALVTGMLIGMNMSPSIPLFIPIIASAFAIAVCKWTFGGLGANWANPAIGGRVFVFFSFTSAMSSFTMPRSLVIADATSSATPLSLVKTIVSSGEALGSTSLDILSKEAYPMSSFAQKISSALGISGYNIDAFIGNIPGCIGEVSSLLLIAGGIYLLCRKIITWHIPVSFIGTWALLTWVFGGIPNGNGAFHGEVISNLLRGGLILGALFMATDMVTSPITYKGMVIFGAGCGFFTFLFRSFGSLPEATSVAILLMNIVVPTIDRFCIPKKFGESVKEEKK